MVVETQSGSVRSCGDNISNNLCGRIGKDCRCNKWRSDQVCEWSFWSFLSSSSQACVTEILVSGPSGHAHGEKLLKNVVVELLWFSCLEGQREAAESLGFFLVELWFAHQHGSNFLGCFSLKKKDIFLRLRKTNVDNGWQSQEKESPSEVSAILNTCTLLPTTMALNRHDVVLPRTLMVITNASKKKALEKQFGRLFTICILEVSKQSTWDV